MKQFKKRKTAPRFLAALLLAAVISCAGLFMTGCGDDLDEMDTVDLTSMSSTMVYSYVYDMLYTRPNAYIGKTVIAKGQYSRADYESLAVSKYRHYIVISDATACCAQGIEFVFEGEYPAENDTIKIEGTFEKYVELGTTYYFLSVSSLAVV